LAQQYRHKSSRTTTANYVTPPLQRLAIENAYMIDVNTSGTPWRGHSRPKLANGLIIIIIIIIIII
jgi:hypothetical protein